MICFSCVSVPAELRKITAPTVRGHLSSTSSAGTRLFSIADCRLRIADWTGGSLNPQSAVRNPQCFSHAPLLRRAAAVVRQRRHVLDARDLQARVLKLKHGLL